MAMGLVDIGRGALRITLANNGSKKKG